MTANQAWGAAATILAVSVGGGLYFSDDGSSLDESGEVAVQAAQVDTRPVRMARLPAGKCTPDICPRGSISGSGWCACLTPETKETLVKDEVTTVEAKDKRKMVLCKGAVSYPPAAEQLKPGCREVLPDVLIPGVVTNGIPTGIEADLERVCGWPAGSISPGEWGVCPECLDWPKGCPSVADGGGP